MVPRDTPGVVVHNDWDALGMRASGTHSISFENVQLPLSRFAAARGRDAVGYMNRTLTAGLLPRGRRARRRGIGARRCSRPA